jgi:hypothetical protein
MRLAVLKFASYARIDRAILERRLLLLIIRNRPVGKRPKLSHRNQVNPGFLLRE